MHRTENFKIPVGTISVPAAIYTRYLLNTIQKQVVLTKIQVFWDDMVHTCCNIPPNLNLEVRSVIAEKNYFGYYCHHQTSSLQTPIKVPVPTYFG